MQSTIIHLKTLANSSTIKILKVVLFNSFDNFSCSTPFLSLTALSFIPSPTLAQLITCICRVKSEATNRLIFYLTHEADAVDKRPSLKTLDFRTLTNILIIAEHEKPKPIASSLQVHYRIFICFS